MKKSLLLAVFASLVSFAASAETVTYTGSDAKIIYTNLMVERSLNGDKSGIEEYMSASIGKPGQPNTQVHTLVKAGSEAKVSCTQTMPYKAKVTIVCDISPINE